MIQGTIIRVAGPVVDVQFTAGRLPALQEALTVTAEGTERTMEVTQHVNETTVRCIMLSARRVWARVCRWKLPATA